MPRSPVLVLVLTGCVAVSSTGSPTTTPTSATGCELLEPSERLVLPLACVDGLCGGHTYAEAEALLGPADGCAAEGTKSRCTWGDLAVVWPDCDGNGLPDDPAVDPCSLYDMTLTVAGGWDGANVDGLGLGVDAACWEEVLGPPGPSGGWEYGEQEFVWVTIEPGTGPVTSIVLDWTYDE